MFQTHINRKVGGSVSYIFRGANALGIKPDDFFREKRYSSAPTIVLVDHQIETILNRNNTLLRRG